MSALRALIPIITLAAVPAASEPVLDLPVDCILGQSCFIQNHVDADPGPGWQDYACGPLSYDGHDGTDFAVPTLADMHRGVSVLASAAGTVTALRDGMADDGVFPTDGRDCGNGLVIDHGDGWVSQYCHMKNGGFTVRLGERVDAGTKLGQIGLSGRTEFPHLHLAVRHNGKPVDPFAPKAEVPCGPQVKKLWKVPPPYHAGGLIAAGFADAVPSFDSVRAGTATPDLSRTADALVLFGLAYGVQEGDRMTLRIDGPQGQVIENAFEFDRSQAQAYRAAGRKRTTMYWPSGSYEGHVILRRGAEVLGEQTLPLAIP